MSGDERQLKWCERVLTSFEKGNEAELISTAKSYQHGFFTYLLHTISSQEPERTQHLQKTRSLLGIIYEHCPVDDAIFDVLEADVPDVDILDLVLFSINVLLGRDRKVLFLEWCLSHAKVVTFQLLDSNKSSEAVCSKVIPFSKIMLHNLTPLTAETKCLFVAHFLRFLDPVISHLWRDEVLEVLYELIPNPFYLKNALDVLLNRSTFVIKGCHLMDTSISSMSVYFYYAIKKQKVCVYSIPYCLTAIFPLANALLSDDCKDKSAGLQLIDLSLPGDGSLTRESLLPELKPLLISLHSVVLFDTVKTMRELALKSLVHLLDSFNDKSQYLLYLNWRPHLDHSGTLALIISRIKNCLNVTKKPWVGKQLCDILELYCFLQEGDDFSLVSNAEEIIASLNLFWYLLKRSSNNSLPQIGNLVSLVRNKYLPKLEPLVKKTLEECNDQLCKLERGELEETPNISLQIDLPELSQQDKIQSIMYARNAAELVNMNMHKLFDFFEENL